MSSTGNDFAAPPVHNVQSVHDRLPPPPAPPTQLHGSGRDENDNRGKNSVGSFSDLLSSRSKNSELQGGYNGDRHDAKPAQDGSYATVPRHNDQSMHSVHSTLPQPPALPVRPRSSARKTDDSRGNIAGSKRRGVHRSSSSSESERPTGNDGFGNSARRHGNDLGLPQPPAVPALHRSSRSQVDATRGSEGIRRRGMLRSRSSSSEREVEDFKGGSNNPKRGKHDSLDAAPGHSVQETHSVHSRLPLPPVLPAHQRSSRRKVDDTRGRGSRRHTGRIRSHSSSSSSEGGGIRANISKVEPEVQHPVRNSADRQHPGDSGGEKGAPRPSGKDTGLVSGRRTVSSERDDLDGQAPIRNDGTLRSDREGRSQAVPLASSNREQAGGPSSSGRDHRSSDDRAEAVPLASSNREQAGGPSPSEKDHRSSHNRRSPTKIKREGSLLSDCSLRASPSRVSRDSDSHSDSGDSGRDSGSEKRHDARKDGSSKGRRAHGNMRGDRRDEASGRGDGRYDRDDRDYDGRGGARDARDMDWDRSRRGGPDRRHGPGPNWGRGGRGRGRGGFHPGGRDYDRRHDRPFDRRRDGPSDKLSDRSRGFDRRQQPYDQRPPGRSERHRDRSSDRQSDRKHDRQSDKQSDRRRRDASPPPRRRRSPHSRKRRSESRTPPPSKKRHSPSPAAM